MKTSAMLAAIGLFCVPMLNVDPAHAAGAARTWISGVGSDGNPCSRTAPCITFAGLSLDEAISREIMIVLEPAAIKQPCWPANRRRCSRTKSYPP